MAMGSLGLVDSLDVDDGDILEGVQKSGRDAATGAVLRAILQHMEAKMAVMGPRRVALAVHFTAG